MIQLAPNQYYKAEEALRQVKINHLFAMAVVEGHVNGTVYVDNVEDPTSFYVIHPYGMSLLFGEPLNNEFNAWLLEHAINKFKTRDRYEWLQAFPETWNLLITHHWSDYLIDVESNKIDIRTNAIEVNTRVNFRFNKTTYLNFKHSLPADAVKVVRTDKNMFEQMKGSVIPSRFWNNADDFAERAIAFSVMDGNIVAGTAFSAFIIGSQLEIGIETTDGYRGKGYATKTCMALIDYCLENGFEPLWACKFDNTASLMLAQKLGFEPVVYWPFYRLPY